MTVQLRRSSVLVALAITFAMAFTVIPQVPAADAGGDKASGGKAVAHRADGRRAASAQRKAPAAKLHRITVDGTRLNASEPTLGLTRDGDVFYTAFQTNTRIEVAHSKDKGQTWGLRSPEIGGRNVHSLSFDPYIYVDPATSRIFNIDLTVACSYLSFSDNKGKSWITNPLACGRPVNDHQTLFAGPPVHTPTVGYENIVYYCWNDVGSSSCSKSVDGGLTFSPTGAPAFPGVDPDAGGQDSNFCGGLHAHGYVGKDGTVYLPKGHCGQPWLAISKDEGKTWSRVQVAANGAATHEAGVAADSKGNIYYAWTARNRLPYLVVSKNGGKTWSKPLMIGAPGLKEANLPGLDVGAPGKVAVVYMGSENSPFRPGREDGGNECTAIGSCPSDDSYKKTTWNGYMMVTANALDKNPTLFTGTVNNKRDPLVRDTCGPGRCRAVYDFIDIVIGPDGSAWGAFVDACISICASTGTSNLGSEAVVGHLVGGPKLR